MSQPLCGQLCCSAACWPGSCGGRRGQHLKATMQSVLWAAAPRLLPCKPMAPLLCSVACKAVQHPVTGLHTRCTTQAKKQDPSHLDIRIV